MKRLISYILIVIPITVYAETKDVTVENIGNVVVCMDLPSFHRKQIIQTEEGPAYIYVLQDGSCVIINHAGLTNFTSTFKRDTTEYFNHRRIDRGVHECKHWREDYIWGVCSIIYIGVSSDNREKMDSIFDNTIVKIKDNIP